MGVFRFETRYAAPSREQRERYMRGEVEENHFGPDGEITLLLYPEGAYLKDETDGTRILFTGIREKQNAVEEAMRLAEYYRQRSIDGDGFVTGDEV